MTYVIPTTEDGTMGDLQPAGGQGGPHVVRSHGNKGRVPCWMNICCQQDDETEDLDLPGVIEELGSLSPKSIISEEGVARIFSRHAASVC